MKKRRTRFLVSMATCCLMALAAQGQSYTIHFITGTARINLANSRTVDNLEELEYKLNGCKGQTAVVTLTALQNVVDRYDPDAKALALEQAVALQDYLNGGAGSEGRSMSFDIQVDAQTDLENRVIVEVCCSREAVQKPKKAAVAVDRVPANDGATLAKAAGNGTTTPNTTREAPRKQADLKAAAKPVKPADFWLGGIGIGIKTNALLFAGLLPDGSMYSPVPNAAAEVYFLDRFSAQLSFAYAMPYNKGDKNNLFKMTAFTVEPRFWLWNGGRYKGLYAGVYGQYGTFDVRIKEEIADNCTGSFYGGGISVGWLQPLWKGLFAEVGLQAGYRSDATDVYTYTAGKPYKKDASYTLNSFTLQGLNVSVGYRF